MEKNKDLHPIRNTKLTPHTPPLLLGQLLATKAYLQKITDPKLSKL
jgi:hypothetical protein